MSENVERMIREGFAAFNRGDFEAATAMFHPEIEWIAYLSALEGKSYTGREAIARSWSELDESFGGSLRGEVREVIDRGETVIVVLEARGTGVGSGADITQGWAMLARIREGLIVRVESFADRDAALKAAGLSE